MSEPPPSPPTPATELPSPGAVTGSSANEPPPSQASDFPPSPALLPPHESPPPLGPTSEPPPSQASDFPPSHPLGPTSEPPPSPVSESAPGSRPRSDDGLSEAASGQTRPSLTPLMGVCTDCHLALSPSDVEHVGARCPICREPLTLLPKVSKSSSSQSLGEESSSPGTPAGQVPPTSPPHTSQGRAKTEPETKVKVEAETTQPLPGAPKPETQAQKEGSSQALDVGLPALQLSKEPNPDDLARGAALLFGAKAPDASAPGADPCLQSPMPNPTLPAHLPKESPAPTVAEAPKPASQVALSLDTSSSSTDTDKQVLAKGPPAVPPPSVLMPPPAVPEKATQRSATPSALVMTDEVATTLATLLTQLGKAPQGQPVEALLASVVRLMGQGTKPLVPEDKTEPAEVPSAAKDVRPIATPVRTNEAAPAASPPTPTPTGVPAPAASPGPAPAPIASHPLPPTDIPKASPPQKIPAVFNSATHPREWKLMERFTEANPIATELKKAWAHGGSARLNAFAKFVQAGCALAAGIMHN